MKRRISITLFIILALAFFLFGFGPNRSLAPKKSPASFGQQLHYNPDYGKLPLPLSLIRARPVPNSRAYAGAKVTGFF
jgi:hypothetical protein